ncbi:MAG: hypothetical protein V2A73_11060, partial [Pseudomonadota bacterium]
MDSWEQTVMCATTAAAVSLGHAQLVLGVSRGVAKNTLDVFGEGRVAESPVYFQTERGKEELAFLIVELGTLASKRGELLVHLFPVDEIHGIPSSGSAGSQLGHRCLDDSTVFFGSLYRSRTAGTRRGWLCNRPGR